MGTFDAMMTMIKIRYSKVDDNGKSLLPHPYQPWDKPSDPKYQSDFDDAYRASKMFENVKEWTLMSLPIMWCYAIYGSAIPFMSDGKVEISILLSTFTWMYGTYHYTRGYVKSVDERIFGFKIRTYSAQFWMFGAGAGLVAGLLERFDLLPSFLK